MQTLLFTFSAKRCKSIHLVVRSELEEAQLHEVNDPVVVQRECLGHEQLSVVLHLVPPAAPIARLAIGDVDLQIGGREEKKKKESAAKALEH